MLPAGLTGGQRVPPMRGSAFEELVGL
jgi:hypothetical protein